MKRTNRNITQNINQELSYQLQTTGESENTYFLPTVADPTDKQVERYVSSLVSIMKKQVVHPLNGSNAELNDELARVVRIIRDEAYSLGIKHMDQMHINTEK